MTEPNKVEAERQRMAQHIGEDIIASLRLIQTQTETYRSALQHQPEASTALNILSSLLQQVIQRAVHLRNSLYPTLLETHGLEAALESFAAELRRVQGLHIHLHLPRLPQRLPYHMEIVLFRTIQSLVDWASTNAGAAHFDIRLQSLGQRVVLHYEDDGRWILSQTHFLQAFREEFETVSGHLEGTLTSENRLVVRAHVETSPELMLTPRECEVLQFVAEGMTNKDISAQLHVSARTVSFHLDNVYTKLHVNTRTEAVIVALQRGWIENPAK